MKKCITLSAAVLAATFSLTPFVGAQQQTAQEQQQQQQQQRQQEQGQQAGQMNLDQHFVKEAASDNQYEIQLGQFVEQHAQNQQVKQLAQRLVQDHQRAQQQLEQAAKQAGLQVPSQLEQWQQEKLQMCQQKTEKHPGEMADAGFAFGQVGDHRTDLLKYQFEAEHSQNAQIKQYAQETIPVLEEHLRMAEQAAEQWVPQARTAGEHMRGAAAEHGGAAGGASYNASGNGTSTNQQGTPSSGSGNNR